MRKLFFVLFILGYVGFCNGQVVTVSDFKTGKPLEMVTLLSESPRAFTVTNAVGQADIHQFKGSGTIEVRILGYTTLYRSFAQLEADLFKIVLEPSGVSLDELIISGTRWNQPSKKVPAKITTISVQSVTLENPQTTADVLESSGEVYIQKSQQGGGSPMIRGFSTNRLLYVVDGVRMNTAIFRSGNLQNVISIDPFANEQTEILFGPGGVIYGSDAIGGVMSFTTLTPQFSYNNNLNINGKAVLRYSSANGERTGHVHINAGWKKWAFVTGFSHFDFGDLKMGSHGPDDYLRPFYVQRQNDSDIVVTNSDPLVQNPTGYSQDNFTQKISYKPGDHWRFDYIFHYSATSDYSRYDRLIRTKNGLPRSAEWYYGPQKWMMNQLAITNDIHTRLYDSFTMRLAHQYFEESRNDRDFNDSEKRNRTEKVDAYSVNLDLIKHIGQKLRLVYGAEAVIDEVESTGLNTDVLTGEQSEGPSRYPQSDWSSYAAYFNLQHRLSDKTDLMYGLRYNAYRLNASFDTTFYPFPFTSLGLNNGALSGSLGIVHRPSETWVLSVNASTGFRAPNVDDAGKVFDSEPGSVVVPNPDLKAEKVYNAEFSVVKLFGDILRLDATAYYTLLNDAMVRRDYTLGGMDSIVYDGELSQVQAIQNAAKATVYGVQAGFELKLHKGWGLSTRVNYQKGEEELDDGTTGPLRHAAPFYGVSRLNFTYEKLVLELYTVYNGEVSYRNLPEESKSSAYLFASDADGNPYSPAWCTLNFKLLYKVNDIFTLTGGLENITDKRYRPYSSGISAPGRNFIFALNLRF